MDIELYINRICSGYIDLDGVLYKHPSQKVLYQANLLYNSIINDEFNKKDALDILEKLGQWNKEFESEIEEHIPRVIEDLKLEIYQHFNCDKNKVILLKQKLEKVKDRLMKLLSIKHSLNEYTIEGLAEKEKTLFLIRKCCKLKDKTAESLLNTFYENQLSDSVIRQICKSPEWSLKWNVMKKGLTVFSGNINSEQELLLRWSSIYENIYENEECPSEDIINDDDALDGWMIWQKREALRKKGIEGLESRIKDKNAQEVYLPINPHHPIINPTEEDIKKGKEIDLLNSPEAIQLKRSRFEQIQKKGFVPEFDIQNDRLVGGFVDTQMRVALARNNVKSA